MNKKETSSSSSNIADSSSQPEELALLKKIHEQDHKNHGKKKELQEQLRDANERIRFLQNILKMHGIDPESPQEVYHNDDLFENKIEIGKSDSDKQEEQKYDKEDEEESLSSIISKTKSNKRLPSRYGKSESEYIKELVKFADQKCDEVDDLITQILVYRNREAVATQSKQNTNALINTVNRLQKEKSEIAAKLKHVKSLAKKFAIQHQDNKAERKTNELQELAKQRAQFETQQLELYSFIIFQLQAFFNVESHDIDEKTVRCLIAQAAAKLREIDNQEA